MAFLATALRRLLMVLLLSAACPAWALDSLQFQTPGADKDLRRALEQASLLLAAQRDKATGVPDLLSAAQAEYAALLGALYAQGHYSGVIHVMLDGQEAAGFAALLPPDRIDQVVVTVDPGPRFLFSQARIAPLAPGTELPPRFALNRIARSTVIKEAADAALGQWRATGHAKVAVADQSIVADHAARRLAVQVALAPGPVLRFGRFTVTGDSEVRPGRIADIAGFPTGAVFSPDALEKSAARLRRTGSFQSVTVTEAEQPNPDGTLDFALALVDQPKRRLGFGAEVASLDGVSVTGYWLHRNFLGGAEAFRADGKITGIGGADGGPDYSLGFRLSRPGMPDPDSDAFVAASLEHEDKSDFRADRGSIGIGYSRQLRLLRGEVGLNFAYERATDALGTSHFTTLALPLAAEWDRRDTKANPTTGSFLRAELEPFLGFQDAGTGARAGFDGRVYRSLADGGKWVAAARLQGGAVFGSNLFDTPRDYLFYSGGGGTVRGQPYQSLGVTVPCPAGSAAGCTVDSGGLGFVGLSGELRGRISDTLGLVAFADAGFISADPFGTGAFHSGAGIGLRLNTGIGPIRFDLAVPVGGSTGKGAQLYVGIGQAF